jgi:hypothetical protein
MCRLPYVTIMTDCPISRLGPVSITIEYAINKHGIAVGRAHRCFDSKDSVATCHKCVAFFSSYVSYHPLPKDGDFIPADLDHYSSMTQECPEYKQDL